MRTVIESANADHTCARDPAIRLRGIPVGAKNGGPRPVRPWRARCTTPLARRRLARLRPRARPRRPSRSIRPGPGRLSRVILIPDSLTRAPYTPIRPRGARCSSPPARARRVEQRALPRPRRASRPLARLLSDALEQNTRRKLEPGAYGGVEYEPASDSTGQSQRLSGESIEREYRGGAFRLRSGFVQA